MFKRIGRRFHSAKYVFSVQLHKVNPWFMHDRPAKLVWSRGSKKHKRGETPTKTPTHVEGAHVNRATLDVEESFEVGVTLYAQSHRTRKTGPYGKKDLRVVIMEVDDDGSIYSVLGALTINLNEYAGLTDHKIQVPIECDHEITDAVGQPYFDVTIRSWYKQGHGTSASSGISSTGWEDAERSASDVEEHEGAVVVEDTHLDPVRPIDVIDPHKTVGTDSVPEDIQADGTGHKQLGVQGAAIGVQQTRQAIGESVNTQSTQQAARGEVEPSLAVVGFGGNNDRPGTETREVQEPIAIEEKRPELVPDMLDETNLISVGLRYKRLSTINSETGEEIAELVEQEKEDELNKFLEQEIKEEELGLEAVPATVATAPSSKQPSMKEPSTETTNEPPKEETAIPVKEEAAPEQAEASSDIKFADLQPEAAVVAAEVNKEETPKPEVKTEAAQEVVQEAPQEVTKPTTEKSVSQMVAATEQRVPVGIPHRPPPRHRPLPPRTGIWSCLPGSGLICCQPLLPRET